MGRALHRSWSKPSFIKAPATVAASCRQDPSAAPETGGAEGLVLALRVGLSPVLEVRGLEPGCRGLKHTVVSTFVVSLVNGMTTLPATPGATERTE